MSAFTIIVGGRTKGSVGMSLVNLGDLGLNGRELEKLGGGVHKGGGRVYRGILRN